MTEQDLYAFGDALRANPRSFSQFDANERVLVETMLLPHPSFSDWQKEQLRRWKLLVPNQAVIDSANAALAASGEPHRIAARTAINGDLLLESDLLSDRQGNYAPIRTFLEGLLLVSRPESDFPQSEGPE